MNTGRIVGYLPPFVLATLLVLAWATVVQVQLNFAVLEDIGHRIPLELRLRTLGVDLLRFGAFFSVIVVPTLLVAFLLAGWIASHFPALRTALFVLGGAIGLAIAIPLVQWLSPLALLMQPTRHVSGLLAVAAGGLFAGLLFAWMTRRASRG